MMRIKSIKKSWLIVSGASVAVLALWLAASQASAGPSPFNRSPDVIGSHANVSQGAIGTHVNVNQDDTRGYWTPARMRAAKGVEMIVGRVPGKQRAVGQGTTYGTPGQVAGGSGVPTPGA